MNRVYRTFKTLMLGLAASAAMFLAVGQAIADKVVQKDGTVLEGTILEEQADFVRIKLSDGTVLILAKDEIRRIEREAKEQPEAQKPAAPADAKTDAKPSDGAASAPAPVIPPSGGKKDDKKQKREATVSGATRVAIINFGAPSSWMGKIDSGVGSVILAKPWKDAIPLLEKDKIDVVVVRVNSGGGALSEIYKFHEVFAEYKKKWRTVVWCESAISAAAMSPWVIEEWYFLPEGNAGACTGYYGDSLIAMAGAALIDVQVYMEQASVLGKHDLQIMRAMQHMDPLSCNIDENNNITWFQGTSGKYLVNPPGRVLTLNAVDAMKYRFAKGIAATPEELGRVMGLNEVEWVGQAATKLVDDSMRKNDDANKRYEVIARKYEVAVRGAMALRGENNRDRRLVEVGVARRHLNELEQLMKSSPSVAGQIRQGYIAEQRELLKELAK